MPTLPQTLRRGRGLPTFAALTLGFMVLVILWGAVVRATGSGAGCGNHWPLCNGEFVPRHPRLATIVEFTHRSMSGICTALVAALLAWTFAARPKAHPARKAAVTSAVLLLTEAFLGAVLVKGGYVENNTSDARVLMQCVHFTNTMLLLAALTLTWRLLRTGPSLRTGSLRTQRLLRPTPSPDQPTSAATSLAWASILLTLVVGATGSVAALADTLFPAPSLRQALAQDFSSSAPLLVRMRWMHPASVVLAGAVVLAYCYRRRESSGARLLTALLVAQILLGTLVVLLLAPVVLQVLHLLLADLYWIALISTAAAELLPLPSLAAVRPALGEGRSVPV